MKKMLSLVLVVFVSFILVSCENKDEVADEIVHYYNEKWISINDMKEKEMRDPLSDLAKLEKQNKEEEAAVVVKDEVIPIADKVLERLDAVDSDNKKVKKMNDMQIEAEEIAREMSKKTAVYYKDGDVSEQDLKQYDEKMKDKYQDFLDYRDKLIDKYNLEQTENEDEDSKFHKLKRAEE